MNFKNLINSEFDFNNICLEVFQFQATNNLVYREYLEHFKVKPEKITLVEQIPFLPVEFFKTHKVIADGYSVSEVFTSSGTTGSQTSRHYVVELELYEESFSKGFQYFYGNPQNYCILALLPSYLERKGSSLAYMAEKLIGLSRHPQSGFYLYNYEELVKVINELSEKGQKVLLLGVTFALLDLAENFQLNLKNVIVMETGGMKGRRKEITRQELHKILAQKLGIEAIHSEYGMTELLSQAYSKGNGIFNCPPWMKVLIRDTYDPFTYLPEGKTGGMNVIDLANYYSCSFIETKDLGKLYNDGSFEVSGRFDQSDIRGCNLLV